MPTETFRIPNISCGHCTRAIENELKSLEGVSDATGDIPGKSATVSWDEPADRAAILERLREIGYPAAE
jgi:copper chaperone